jgi:hypothetical protein
LDGGRTSTRRPCSPSPTGSRSRRDVNLIINGAQKIETLYYSTSTWSWWVAHAIFGMTLGILGALLLRRERSGAEQSQAACAH